MSKLNFFKRGTLLVPSGTPEDPKRKHLHVICTDPDAAGKQLLVSISTFYPGADPTCILRRDRHPWLTKEASFVEYRYTRLRRHFDLIEGVRRDIFLPKEDMNGQDFLRVCRGIERSPQTPEPMCRFYRRMAAAERGARTPTTGPQRWKIPPAEQQVNATSDTHPKFLGSASALVRDGSNDEE